MDKPIRRGLVIQGGGAKGAFALGCLKAFKENQIEFVAVAGTSAGALCAIIWSADKVEEGISACLDTTHANFFGAQPEGCLWRYFKIVSIAGRQFYCYFRGIEPQGEPKPRRDIICSVLVGLMSLIFLPILPWAAWFPMALLASSLSICSLYKWLPIIGTDETVRQRVFLRLIGIASAICVAYATWLIYYGIGIVDSPPPISYESMLAPACFVLFVRLCLERDTVLMSGKAMQDQLRTFLSGELTIPTSVTLSEELPPHSKSIAPSRPGLFHPHYAVLEKCPLEQRLQFAYASAALPFGILPCLTFEGRKFVDGGVSDNTPVWALLLRSDIGPLDEIWIIKLQPGYFDLKTHLIRVMLQMAHGIGKSPRKDGPSWVDDLVGKHEIIWLQPSIDLGGLVTGTLNFTAKRSRSCIRHGYLATTARLAEWKVSRSSRTEEVEETKQSKILPRGSLHSIKALWAALPACNIKNIFSLGSHRGEDQTIFPVPDETHRTYTDPQIMRYALLLTCFVAQYHALGSGHQLKTMFLGFAIVAFFQMVLPGLL